MGNVLRQIPAYSLMMMRTFIMSVFVTLFFLNSSLAATYVILPKSSSVGEIKYVYAEGGETLEEIGKQNGVGLIEIKKANPKVQSLFLSQGERVLIPSRYMLPKMKRQGIIISLSQYRLFYFPKNENLVMTFPIGIGRKGFSTPTGVTKIIAKERNPYWHPSKRLVSEAKKNGVLMPSHFPAGQYNPLGPYVLRLGWSGYLIHGSKRGGGVGQQVSAGCIRMLPEDIEYLFSIVPNGTRVSVVN